MKERELEYPEKTHDDELRKMPYIKKPKNSSPNQDSSIGGRLEKQTCQPLHHASP